MRVLVTGAAGLVGCETLERLRAAGADAVGTSRPRSAAPAGLVAWDIAAAPAPAALAGSWDAIVHAAADTRWTLAAGDAERANVATVAALAPLVGRRTHVVHVSTAYAAGLRGSVASTALDDYRNTYEWSKAGAERLARERFARLTIVRPPLVMGRRGDGRATRFSGMYALLRAMTASMVPAVVAEPDAWFEAIPVDDLATLLADAALGSPGTGEVLTIACGARAPRVGDAVAQLTGALNDWRGERGLEPYDAPPLIPAERWERFFLPFIRDELTPRQLRVVELLANFQPYLAIDEPLTPTHPVADVQPCIAASVRYWANRHRRNASQPLRFWRAAA